ncbi:YjjG family noncanonical pyrimidine nucleotidase [Sporosarcina highlanderae]|uniref:YjjG family noncanonical pyrimidine nucleotidase n=1 Tax=Sporosarcina highlanderae TaxID=3035916 RepID=A0ABT8JRD3_9BACL|nr:YjjG family noncanonical pyrimidine nucleotidase [Sporosarcina highlanderae]MDN4606734.1 YjjG family noncanonical pyrimidine nucleotidase [Sporosarcina highlanderae]
MKYDVFLFDLDDTLMDFVETEKNAFTNVFTTHGFPNALTDFRDTYRAVSTVLWGDLEQGKMALSELKTERFRRLFLEHGLEMDAEAFGQLYLDYLGKEVHLIDGVTRMLHSLEGARLAVLTNGFKDVQLARIAASGLSDTFEAIFTSEEIGFQKPQPGIFEHVFKQLQIKDKSRVLMVGDSLSSDIRGGNNFGIDTCWYNPNRKENNGMAKPTYEIHDWEEFQMIVNQTIASR